MAVCTLMAWLLVQSASRPKRQQQDGASDCGFTCNRGTNYLFANIFVLNNPGLVIGPSDSWHLSKSKQQKQARSSKSYRSKREHLVEFGKRCWQHFQTQVWCMQIPCSNLRAKDFTKRQGHVVPPESRLRKSQASSGKVTWKHVDEQSHRQVVDRHQWLWHFYHNALPTNGIFCQNQHSHANRGAASVIAQMPQINEAAQFAIAQHVKCLRKGPS